MINSIESVPLRKGLDTLYKKYNRRRFVHPDPLEFLYEFPESEREIVGIIASSLAYGRVWSILKAVEICLDRMDNTPKTFLLKKDATQIEKSFKDFKHRFTKGPEMAAFLIGLKKVLNTYGSLEALFNTFSNERPGQERTIKRLTNAVHKILKLSGLEKTHLLPDPAKKSACKRLFLFLRWMVRKDEVDPGGWSVIAPSELVIPLDTHMFNISKSLGFTQRKQANLSTALEITSHFLKINPEDPIKYDFVLTRFGIRDELSRDDVRGLLIP